MTFILKMAFFGFSLLIKFINVAFMSTFMLKYMIRLTLKRHRESFKSNEMHVLSSISEVLLEYTR